MPRQYASLDHHIIILGFSSETNIISWPSSGRPVARDLPSEANNGESSEPNPKPRHLVWRSSQTWIGWRRKKKLDVSIRGVARGTSSSLGGFGPPTPLNGTSVVTENQAWKLRWFILFIFQFKKNEKPKAWHTTRLKPGSKAQPNLAHGMGMCTIFLAQNKSGFFPAWPKLARPIWKAKTKPKCKFLMWILLHKEILTASNLEIRGWPDNHICSLCNMEPENTKTSMQRLLLLNLGLGKDVWLVQPTTTATKQHKSRLSTPFRRGLILAVSGGEREGAWWWVGD